MNWITEHAAWMLVGLVVVTVIFWASFSARNQKAKSDDLGFSENKDTIPNSAPIKKTRQQ